MIHETQRRTPIVVDMQVIPVAGHDSMLLNLCGAHAPHFTRNLVVLQDNAGSQQVLAAGGQGWDHSAMACVLEKLANFEIGQKA